MFSSVAVDLRMPIASPVFSFAISHDGLQGRNQRYGSQAVMEKEPWLKTKRISTIGAATTTPRPFLQSLQSISSSPHIPTSSPRFSGLPMRSSPLFCGVGGRSNAIRGSRLAGTTNRVLGRLDMPNSEQRWATMSDDVGGGQRRRTTTIEYREYGRCSRCFEGTLGSRLCAAAGAYACASSHPASHWSRDRLPVRPPC
jgi:hypothetical protein